MQATDDGTGALRSWEEEAARHRMQWCASGRKATRRLALDCGDSETGRPGASHRTRADPDPHLKGSFEMRATKDSNGAPGPVEEGEHVNGATTTPDTESAKAAVSYLRVSTKGQVDGDGLPRQRATIRGHARSLGIKVLEEFVDAGVSGVLPLAERPGLTALLERVAGNGVRTVLVAAADRLSRDLVESELALREFRSAGVTVIECEGGNDLSEDGNPTRVLIRHVLGALAQWDRSNLVAKLRLNDVDRQTVVRQLGSMAVLRAASISLRFVKA